MENRKLCMNLSLLYREFILSHWTPIFMGFVSTGEPRTQIFNEYHSFNSLCIQRFAKPRKQVSTKMQVLSYPRKLIAMKMNESTVVYFPNKTFKEFIGRTDCCI